MDRTRTKTAGDDARARWTGARTGDWYDASRWSNASRRERDPRLVDAILRTHAPHAKSVLDAPSGTGRLRAGIERAHLYTGLEVSAAMLERAREKSPARLVQGDVTRLPFADGSFDAVLCCRLLHHLRTQAELEAVLTELVRVSSGIVAASFWDAASLAAWRRRLPFTRSPRDRVTHPKARIEAAVRASGARIVRWHHSLRYLSQHTWFVAEREPATAAR